ncbi:hypothetical protein [Streptomyces apricus]|uniref:Uncharacterized protein n=1 Tax=Streptomyces apricus TaxID=1828112 RepID=A0A5A9ZKX8_9ACTN|nr:hypothetical protein [Streptomyces apricus]KAA0917840.1 hypothetical protein FGF04_37950 [Streptomyces apricus]
MNETDQAKGWRIDRIPGKRVTAVHEGVRLPLWLLHDGKHKGDAQLRLSVVEAEQLHAELSYALDEDEAPVSRPAAAH